MHLGQPVLPLAESPSVLGQPAQWAHHGAGEKPAQPGGDQHRSSTDQEVQRNSRAVQEDAVDADADGHQHVAVGLRPLDGTNPIDDPIHGDGRCAHRQGRQLKAALVHHFLRGAIPDRLQDRARLRGGAVRVDAGVDDRVEAAIELCGIVVDQQNGRHHRKQRDHSRRRQRRSDRHAGAQ
jgi:hypothetical protein